MGPSGGRTRARLAVLDLFAGCGGLSLGFSWAGFQVACAIEHDPVAAATHDLNFRPDRGGGARVGHHARDILTEEPDRVLAEDLDGRAPDVLVGGPPCQAFARIGRAKLRDEARRAGTSDVDIDSAHLIDPRSEHADRYLEFVEAIRPRALLIENVPDMASPGGGWHPVSQACDGLEVLGYVPLFTILNAVHYGVPQFRERLLILAYREDVRPLEEHWWPVEYCDAQIPSGYVGTRAVARNAAHRLRDSRFTDREASGRRFFGRSSSCSPLGSPVSAREALMDLPRIDAYSLRRGKRLLYPHPGDPRYQASQCSSYASLMRELPTPARRRLWMEERVSAHVTRFLPRDYGTFEAMAAGQDYIGNVFGTTGSRHRSVREVASSIGARPPPYPEDMFPNKWWKLRPDMPVKTLTAHLGKDSYSHIHYEQGRTITVREAARLQSFPDRFVFAGSMNAGFRMIGNAVPPLLAYAVARCVRRQLTGRYPPDIRKSLVRLR
jgi:DNA (cytosine-5)-methyltransferase 1